MAKRILRIVLEVLSLLVMLGAIVFLIVYWKNIPAQVPNRWDLSGDATEWLDKRVLIAFPVLMAVADVSLLFARTVQFRSLGKSVRIPAPVLLFPLMKLPLLAGFGYVMLCSALVRPLGAWFFPVFFVLVFTPMLVFGVTSWAKGRA